MVISGKTALNAEALHAVCTKHKGSEEEPFCHGETNESQHDEGNCDKNASKLCIHAHHAHWAGVASAVMLFHRLDYPPGPWQERGLSSSLAKHRDYIHNPLHSQSPFSQMLNGLRFSVLLHRRPAMIRNTQFPSLPGFMH